MSYARLGKSSVEPMSTMVPMRRRSGSRVRGPDIRHLLTVPPILRPAQSTGPGRAPALKVLSIIMILWENVNRFSGFPFDFKGLMALT